MQVIGTHRHTLDAKNRLSMPAQFRDELGEYFYVVKAPDECLFVYDQEGWDRLTEQIRLKSATRGDRNNQRFAYVGADRLSLDKNGRFVISQEFIDYAGLKKDVVVFGCDNRIEIWDAKAWDDMMTDAPAVGFEGIIW